MATNKEQLGSTPGDATVIGPSILINGKLSGDEDLTVRGRVEGEVSLTKTLIIETSGAVKADVTVRNAIVGGGGGAPPAPPGGQGRGGEGRGRRGAPPAPPPGPGPARSDGCRPAGAAGR